MMNVVHKVAENNSLYVEGLLKTEGRKVCTEMAETLNVTHDSLYGHFNNTEAMIQSTRQELKSIETAVFANRLRYLLFDDFTINKQYAREIEGVDRCYDSSAKHAYRGLQSVSAMLTDGDVKIPINAKLFLTEALGGADRIKKTQIAETILEETPCNRAIWDAHYTTQSMIEKCHALNRAYLGKIPRHRLITIAEKTAQIQKLVKLTKNRKILSVQADFQGIPCWIHAIKRSDKKVVYLISNDYIKPKLIAKLYKIRWKIECFHRTSKQMLGMKQCQMRCFKKQELHVLSVMLAYAHAELVRVRFKLKHTEGAIRFIRSQKHTTASETTQLEAVLS